MNNTTERCVLTTADRIRADVTNISDCVGQELGYVKSILHAIVVLARQDAEANKDEIASLANCATWMSENLESNIDHFGCQILTALPEVANG
jgi:hypothetical protein